MSSRFVMPFADIGDGINPADGAKLKFYDAGTSTLKDTYSNEALSTPNANPVIADADGVFGDIWVEDGARYKVQLLDKNDVQRFEADPVIGGLFSGSSGIIYDTVAVMVAASPQIGQKVVTLGYYAAGDGGHGEYVVAASAAVDGHGDHTLANGNIAVLQTLDGAYNVRQHGVKADSLDCSTEFNAIADTINALADDVVVNVVIPVGEYGINAPIEFSKPNINFMATGARFVPLSDVVMFNLNSLAETDASVVVRMVQWEGGYFDYLDAPTTLIGTAIQGHSTRGVRIENVRFRGIKKCIEASFLDSVKIHGCYFRNFNNAILIPAFHVGNSAQDIWITENNFTVKSAITAKCLEILAGAGDISFSDNGCSLTNGHMIYMDGGTETIRNIDVHNNATEQITSAAIIEHDTSTSTDLEGISIKDNTFGGGATSVIDLARVTGVVDIESNHFVSTITDAIVIAEARPECRVYIDKNNFKTKGSVPADAWNITTTTTGRIIIGDNNYQQGDTPLRVNNANTSITYKAGRYELLASTAALTIDDETSYADITGTTNITSITATWRGHQMFMEFNDILDVVDGSNLKLNGDFTTTSDASMTLMCDGTNWFEQSRSPN